MRSIRLKPSSPTMVGEYELDCIAVELGADETELDFRLELGMGLGIYWALPAARHDRLRLAHVDGAAYDVPEPVLIADPWTCDLTCAFAGELVVLGNGRTLTGVRLELTTQPASYRCELVTRRGDTEELVTRLSWRADDPWRSADAPTRAALLDELVAALASAPELDVGALARVCEEGGRLFDAGHLDGAQYEAIHALLAATRSASPERIRAALARCRVWAAPATEPVLLAPGPVLLGHRAVLLPPAFAPDGSRFVAGDRGGVLIVHERQGATWRHAARVKAAAEVGGVAWSPDGERIASHDRRGVRLHDPRDLSECAFAPYVGDGPVAFGDGAWLAALDRGSLRILTLPNLDCRLTAFVANGEALAVDPAGDVAVVVDGGASEESAMGVVTSRDPATIVVCHVASGKRVAIDPGGPVRGVASDRWRGHLLATCFDRAVVVWTIGGDLVRRFEPYDVPVRALAITARWLVLVPDRPRGEATLDLWSADTLQRRASVAIPGGLPPDWVVASPDGGLLLTRELPAAGDFGIRIWHVDASR